MNQHPEEHSENDPVNLLRHAETLGDAFSPPPGLQEEIYASTLPPLRRRRVRRGLRGASLAVSAYAAGLLSMLTLDREAVPPPTAPPAASAPSQGVAAATTLPEVDAASVEAQAATARFEERPALLRHAADLYLEQQNDVPRALQCYRQYLRLVPKEEAMQIRPDENWLLMSLKRARLQESGVRQST